MREIDHSQRRFFLILSVFYWMAVIVLSIAWYPTFKLMAQVIQMRAEYTLLEQGTKALLLIMFCASMVAYTNSRDIQRVKLCRTFLLFSLILYFAESNFINSIWQPLFGALFIGYLSWQLLHQDRWSLAYLFIGCGFIGLGIVSDVLLDNPEILPDWEFFAPWQQQAGRIEEQFDMWGVAFLTFSCLVYLRDWIVKTLAGHPKDLAILLISVILIASGNGFAHWQYNPSPVFEIIASAMAITGILGLSYFEKRMGDRGCRFTLVDRDIFYITLIAVFVVLPVIYGGSGSPFNLVLWLAFVFYLGRRMDRAHPALPGTGHGDR